MRCAVVNLQTNLIENIIMADATKDAPPNGYRLLNLLDNSQLEIGMDPDKPIPIPEPPPIIPLDDA